MFPPFHVTDVALILVFTVSHLDCHNSHCFSPPVLYSSHSFLLLPEFCLSENQLCPSQQVNSALTPSHPTVSFESSEEIYNSINHTDGHKKRRNVRREENTKEFLVHKRQSIHNWDIHETAQVKEGIPGKLWLLEFTEKDYYFFRIRIKSHTEFTWFRMCCFWKMNYRQFCTGHHNLVT